MNNFRNYRQVTVTPGKGLNIFHGPNGAGKTNLLEAIGILSHGRSPRLKKKEDLIRTGADSGILNGVFLNQTGAAISIRCLIDSTQGKKFIVNGKAAGKLSEVFRLVPTVQCFENDTLLFQGPPGARRDYINALCAQLNSDYLHKYREYKEILLQRNSMIRSGKLTGTMRAAIDEVFVTKAALVTWMRHEAQVKLDAQLSRQNKCFIEETELRIKNVDEKKEATTNDIEESLLRRLQKSRAEEDKRCTTVVGPHRDSFDFEVGKEKIRDRSSRGQIKNMVLRLKISELALLEETLKKRPVVLLDDVFAEMDARRRNNLSYLVETGAQVFWAMTGSISLNLHDDAVYCVHTIDNGRLVDVQEIRAAA